MDLDIRGRKAIVCASSQGLGKACALALAEAGVAVVINARNRAQLESTADEIRKATGVEVIPVAADVSTPQGQEALLAACPAPDILVNNNGGPPYRDFRELDREALLAGVTMNMVTPIELVQRVIDGMAARRFGRIVNITSQSVKMPISGLDLSSGARRPHGLPGRRCPERDRQERHHQQPSARQFLYRASARRLRSRCAALGSLGSGDRGEGAPRYSREAVRRSRRARPRLRLSLQRARRLHHGSKHRDGWRRISRNVLRR